MYEDNNFFITWLVLVSTNDRLREQTQTVIMPIITLYLQNANTFLFGLYIIKETDT